MPRPRRLRRWIHLRLERSSARCACRLIRLRSSIRSHRLRSGRRAVGGGGGGGDGLTPASWRRYRRFNWQIRMIIDAGRRIQSAGRARALMAAVPSSAVRLTDSNLRLAGAAGNEELARQCRGPARNPFAVVPAGTANPLPVCATDLCLPGNAQEDLKIACVSRPTDRLAGIMGEVHWTCGHYHRGRSRSDAALGLDDLGYTASLNP